MHLRGRKNATLLKGKSGGYERMRGSAGRGGGVCSCPLGEG